jgi:hypothetical protein
MWRATGRIDGTASDCDAPRFKAPPLSRGDTRLRRASSPRMAGVKSTAGVGCGICLDGMAAPLHPRPPDRSAYECPDMPLSKYTRIFPSGTPDLTLRHLSVGQISFPRRQTLFPTAREKLSAFLQPMSKKTVK